MILASVPSPAIPTPIDGMSNLNAYALRKGAKGRALLLAWLDRGEGEGDE